MTSDILDDIKKEILSKLPDEIQVSKVEFEGPEVVVYTKNPEIITENGDLIRSLAKELRKRIIIRSDKSALLEQEETINKLLNELKDIPEDKRTATFVCVLTCILQNGESFSVRGETKGSIAKKPGLMGKLTYGPIFVPEKFGKVMNELTQEELGETHREKALKELVQKLK